MTRATDLPRGAYEKFVLLMQDLVNLVTCNEDDGDEAEALRENIDELWYYLTNEEQELVNDDTEALLDAAGIPK